MFEYKKNIWKVTSGVYPSNAYICGTDAKECFLVDPGLGGEDIDATITALNLTPSAIFCTHGHFDHVGSCAFFQNKYNIDVFLHKDDEKTMKASNFLLTVFNIPQRIALPRVTFVDDGFSCQMGGSILRYHHAPGHTPGACVIEWDSALFSGDTLYAKGVGLSHLRGENPEVLKQSILRLFYTLPRHLEILPGHGENATLNEVRLQNRPLLDFLGLAPVSDLEPKEIPS